ncbi:hypothetical protein RIF29_34085 [Crotalaria pallida]|uniref:Uncharacterized protein n=1 Tax=Crotalaria pallida TaxID=3830 RepID=A0AAN9E8V6_CROPI
MPTEVNVNDTSEKRIGESSGATLNVNEPVNEKEGHTQSAQEGIQKQDKGPEVVECDHHDQNALGAVTKENEAVSKSQELVVGGDRTEAENLTNATDSTEIDKEVETMPDSQEDNWTPAKSRRKAIAKLQAQRGEASKAHLVNG